MSAREAIEAELLAWMGEPRPAPDEARFEDLALRLFRHQLEHCPPYARLCAARGATAASVARWQDIPAVPAAAFKELPLRCFEAASTVKTFRTSGTSSERRGELHLDTLALYEASLLPTIRRFLFPDLSLEAHGGGRMTIRVLAPSPEEAPDSSLSHMFGAALAALGSDESGYDVHGGRLAVELLVTRLDSARHAGAPVALCGTAFAFVHLLDALGEAGASLALPPGSRIMETGGFKGRSRELGRDELYVSLEARLGVPVGHIVNQYGMTELGSQFYDSVLAEPEAPRRKLGPPWARVRIVDPESGREAAPGEAGIIAIHDLANTGSVAAIQTADLGRRVPAEEPGHEDGFEVLGRSPDAEERGCSIAADVMLGGGG